MKAYLKKLYFTISLLAIQLTNILAQGPTGIPRKQSEPLPLTLPNILFFFVLPLGLLVFYIWWLKKKRRERDNRINNDKE
ncbi:MAG: hypothetical protein K9J30_05575 [Bacteroidales bacterium]|nr:hypothetical protein [Bacteroidales bacterium]